MEFSNGVEFQDEELGFNSTHCIGENLIDYKMFEQFKIYEIIMGIKTSFNCIHSWSCLFILSNTYTYQYCYNFGLCRPICRSFNFLLNILPLGLLGITSTNSTSFNHLYRALCSSTYLLISWIRSPSFISELAEADLTTKAFGRSPAASSNTDITAESATAG